MDKSGRKGLFQIQNSESSILQETEKNSRRFNGFADVYENARPAVPAYAVETAERYLGRRPQLVVDLGCGTGLSLLAWRGHCSKLIGVEPNAGMLQIAAQKQKQFPPDTLFFVRDFAHRTGIESSSADVVVCSQSFHWMEPNATLREIDRILCPGGVFATVDCDWPPVSHWRVEKAYNALFRQVEQAEQEIPALQNSFCRWKKGEHLDRIRASGYFRYSREIVFSNREEGNVQRMLQMALSQGGLQGVLKTAPERVQNEWETYRQTLTDVFGDNTFSIDFCYRIRIAVK